MQLLNCVIVRAQKERTTDFLNLVWDVVVFLLLQKTGRNSTH